MKTAIIDIPGIGPATEATLAEHGFRTVKKLAKTSREQLAGVPGFSAARADRAISAARELLAAQDSATTEKAVAGTGTAPPDRDRKGKREKDKKDKRGKGRKGKNKKGRDKKNKHGKSKKGKPAG